MLDTSDIMRLLPHRQPMLMIDCIVELDPGRSAVGLKNVSASDPAFAGHFPGEPVYPGVHMVEAAAQVSGIILASGTDYNGFGYLASVRRFKFSRIVRPADQLRISATKKIDYGSLTEFAVELTVEGKTAASGSLAIAFEAR